MNHHHAADAYRAAAIETAPPVKILRMLYEGAIRFLTKAESCDAGSKDQVHWIRRAEDIVSELRITLDHEVNPDVSKQLDGLYGFCLDELGDAVMQRQPERIAEAKDVLATLLEAWKAVQIEGAQA